MSKPYDTDNPSTFTKPRKCGGCGWWFDLEREGTDYPDPDGADRITLCGECCGEASAEAEAMLVKILARAGRRRGSR